jgi:hypothetical protein
MEYMKRGVTCSTHREMRNAYAVLVENTRWKRPIGRSGRRCADNIKINPGGMGNEGVVFKKLEDTLPYLKQSATDFILCYFNSVHYFVSLKPVLILYFILSYGTLPPHSYVLSS